MIFIKEKFRIKNRGIVVELQHQENGLTKGTVLVSPTSKKMWSLEARILYDYALNIHETFSNEFVEYVLAKMLQGHDWQEAGKIIQAEEANNIYYYMIKPLAHNDAPEVNEALIFG